MKQRVLLAIVVVLSIFILLLVVDRVTADTVFLPLIKNGAAQAQTSTHVLLVFSSSATTTGDVGGRTGLGTICANEDPSAHACTLYEIENAMKTTGVFFRDPFTTSWVDTPAKLGTDIINTQSYRITGSSDWRDLSCLGWTTSDSTSYGTLIGAQASRVIWGDSGNLLYDNACNASNTVACCKMMP